MKNKEQVIEILDEYLFSNLYLDENQLAKRLELDPKKLKNFFISLDEKLGFIREGKRVLLAQELIRENIETIHEKFWPWYCDQLPSFSRLAWQEGVEVSKKFNTIKVISPPKAKHGIIKTFSARVVILGEENVGKHSLLYAITGQPATQPAPGVFFTKLTRPFDEFICEIETIILFVPPESSLWLYAKAAFGIILMYDMSRSEETFDKMKYWFNIMLDKYSYEFCPPILILGNKLDLINEKQIVEERKKIEKLREELESTYGTIVQSEMVSLVTSKNVESALVKFIKAIHEWYVIIKEEFPERIVE